ncbi:uncharacterized protein LOC142974563 [Anticarsia gemmatalis]|uniref:uncharacterized protein LOC142974563 n=1 Tax=Anticarsia gemmatalis TaxID=129554 RepID=UPI003F75AF27
MSASRAGRATLRRWWPLALAAALLAALGVSLRTEHEARAHFPRAQPQALAHLLADFSQQPNIGSWTVLEDRSNYTTWRYSVAYECGARCAGRGRVEAHDWHASDAPAHGAAAAHRVTVRLRACAPPPLLPWPFFCDETETVSAVRREAAGARLAVRAWAECSALAALSGACGARLRAQLDAHLLRVRAALHERHHSA